MRQQPLFRIAVHMRAGKWKLALTTVLLFGWCGYAQAQTPPPTDAPGKPAESGTEQGAKVEARSGYRAGTGEEVVTRDSPTTFKVRVNLVLVRVVVRDEHGKVIDN